MNPFSHLSDEELMVLYQKDEYMAFELIYGRHKNRIYSYLNKRLAKEDAVNEVFQNIMLKFHKTRKKYNPDFSLVKWLFTLSKNELLDFQKKKKLVTTAYEDEVFSPNTQEQDLEQINIDKENSLSENEKKAIELRYFSEQEFNEIAKQLKLSENNVRKVISRGLAKLRLKYAGRLK